MAAAGSHTVHAAVYKQRGFGRWPFRKKSNVLAQARFAAAATACGVLPRREIT